MYTTIRELFHDALLHNERFLTCIIPILLDRNYIVLTDSLDSFYQTLTLPEVIATIRTHPSYREYRIWHVTHMKELEIKYSNSLDRYQHLNKEISK